MGTSVVPKRTQGQTVMALVDGLSKNNFYGVLELKLEAGNLVLIRKTETIKPDTIGAPEAVSGVTDETSIQGYGNRN